MTRPFRTMAWRYGVAALGIAVVTGLHWLLGPLFGGDFPFAPLLLAVLVAAGCGGFGPAAVATLLGAVTSVWVLPPHERPSGYAYEHGIGLAFYTAVGFGIAALGRQLHAAHRTEGSRGREQPLQLVADNAPVLLAHCDAEGRFLFVNKLYAERFGLRPRDIVGRSIAEVLGDEAFAVIAPYSNAVLSGQRITVEAEIPYRDFGPRYMRCGYEPEFDARGKVVGYVAAILDLTESKRFERELEESERRFRQLAGNIREVFWMSDPTKHEILYVSPAYEEVWGRPCQSLYEHPRSFIDGIHPEDRDRVRRTSLDRQARGEPADVEYRVVRPDGSVRWVRDRSFPVKDTAGAVYRVAGIAEDVTERRETEEAKRASEERFRGLMEQAPFSVQVLSADGRTVGVNRAWEELWGLTLDSVAHYNVLHDPQLDAKGVSAYLKRAFAGEPVEIPAIEYDPHESLPDRARYEDARRWVSAVAYPLKDVTGRVREVVLVHEDRTARIRAEEALRESEERFRAAVGQAAVGVALVSADNRTLFVNRGLCEMLGYSEAELLAGSFIDVTHPDDLARDMAQIPRLLSGEFESCRYEKRYVHKSGHVLWADLTVSAVRGERGELKYAVAVIADISDRRRASEAMRESEERLRLALDAGRMGVWDWDIRTDEIKWSDNLEPVHGLAPGSFGGTLDAFRQLIHPDDREQVDRAIGRSLEERSSYNIEFRNVWPDGSVHWMSGKGRVFTGDDGRPVRMVGVGIDITERKRAEQDSRFLADASATLAALVDYESTLQKVARLAVPHFADWCTVDMLDEDGALRRLAVAHTAPAKVDLAHELHRRFPADPSDTHGVWKVLRSGKPEITPEIDPDVMAATIKEPDYLRILQELGLRSYMGVPLSVRGKVLGVVAFIAAESGRRYTSADLAVAEDLAHRAAVAIENARLYQEVREADRKKDEFLAILGHELRNPLAPITNALHVLKMPGASTHIAEKAREMIERQVQHMARLVDDLLDVSRIVRGKAELRREPVELATVVARAVEAAQPLVEAERHDLTVALPSEPLRVSGDLVRLAQVVGNLLNNAARYTERGGKIRVEGERVGDKAVLRVRDTGIGIAADALPRIWGMFVQADRRTKAAQGGMGIGLALVRGLVELHGGTVEARSEGLGKGSEFTVTLPLLSEGKQERSDGPEDPPRQVTPRRVLVVDDNVDAAESLATLLRLGGHEARVAYDGATALKLAEAEPPEVAFLDIGMPGLDGYEVARHFRTHPALKHVFLVALTGWGQDEDRRRTKEAGFDGHEVKPAGLEAIDRALSGRSRPA